MSHRAVALAIASAALLAPPAHAVPLVLTDGSSLTKTDSNVLSTTVVTPITGMQAGETLVGIDQRPNTGELYGIGSTSRMYLLDPLTAVATQVGSPGAFTLSGTRFGTDFNPVADRIRQVSDSEQNLRLNPLNGTLAGTDTALTPAGNVVGAAYTNNVAGATSTTLFDIDSVSGKLMMQGSPGGTPISPNTGPLTEVGSLGIGTNLLDAIGFDIGADGANFATITTAAISRLYGINTTTGAATLLGTIGSGVTPYLGLAIMPARLRLTSAAVDASEGGTATFQVTRNTPATGTVSVDYSTAAGTATSGDDFTPASGTVTWGPGESGAKSIVVQVPNDDATEDAETFTLTLANVTGADAVLGAPKSATATIAANAGPPPPPPPSAPANSGLPVITGTPTQGGTLSATDGTWTNSPTSFARQWTRCDLAGANCVGIDGATGTTYVLAATDVGHTLRVAVVATNAGGSGLATSDMSAPIAAPALVVSGAKLSSKKFKAKRGTTLKLTLSRAATVGVVITQRVKGRKVAGKCKRKAKKGKRCHLTVTKAKLSLTGKAGPNSFKFRIARLKRGSYTAKITARDAVGASKPVSLKFTIK